MARQSSEFIQYYEGNEALVQSIKLLWEQLNRHHEERSTYFSQHFAAFSFEDRLRMIDFDRLLFRIELATDVRRGENIAFSMATIDENGKGTIESLYIEPDYRGLYIGDRLMRNVLAWMDVHMVKTRQLSVAVGNESVHKFYERYGFYPRLTVMVQTEERS